MGVTPDLSVDIGGLRIKNPVIAASGTFGYGSELNSFYNPSLLGAIVVKGLSLKPMPGNPPPRIVETPCGLLNSIGLANIGIDAFIEEKLPLLANTAAPVIANIYGHSIGEYGELAGRIEEVDGISAIEVNISCPNVDKGGMVFGTDPEIAATVTGAVVKHTTKPVIVKLTPNVADITVIAKAVESAGARALSVTNTFLGMSVDIASRRPKLANTVGGLSGPAIKPMALYLTYRAAETVKIPVIGVGGIMNYQDAIEFLLVGARAIQVGTGNFINPRAALDIVNGLRDFCEKEHISDINHLIGSLVTGQD
jgi:dihydroorotate dehydrogenase (NAD+) catalytic subunit